MRNSCSSNWLRFGLIWAWLPALALDVQVTDSAGKPVEYAAVYAEPTSQPAPKGKLAVDIDQVDKEFVPLVTAMQVGSKVRFPNKDNVRHHVYSFSPAKAFDLKLYSGTPTEPVIFDKPGQVVLGCNIHDWMLAYALVVDTPWFDTSDERGLARLGDLPAGDYLVKVWHPYQQTEAAPQKIKLAGGVAGRMAFQLKLVPQPARPKAGDKKSY